MITPSDSITQPYKRTFCLCRANTTPFHNNIFNGDQRRFAIAIPVMSYLDSACMSVRLQPHTVSSTINNTFKFKHTRSNTNVQTIRSGRQHDPRFIYSTKVNTKPSLPLYVVYLDSVTSMRMRLRRHTALNTNNTLKFKRVLSGQRDDNVSYMHWMRISTISIVVYLNITWSEITAPYYIAYQIPM